MFPNTFPAGKKDFLQYITLIPHRYSKNCWIKETSKPAIWFHNYCKGSAGIGKGN